MTSVLLPEGAAWFERLDGPFVNTSPCPAYYTWKHLNFGSIIPMDLFSLPSGTVKGRNSDGVADSLSKVFKSGKDMVSLILCRLFFHMPLVDIPVSNRLFRFPEILLLKFRWDVMVQ